MISPALRASLLSSLLSLGQLPDPAFSGAVLRSVLWSIAGFALLAMGVSSGLHLWLAWAGNWSWAAGFAGFLATGFLSVWLFVPLSTAIASLFIDRIADAVERRHYPNLPAARPAPWSAQLGDAALLGLRVLVLQGLAGFAVMIPPHITGVVLSWIVASWAVGRGLFVPVAMRRMDRAHAVLAYRQRRTGVMLLGALITACGLVPLLNLFGPILGAAAMVHVLQRTGCSGGRPGGWPGGWVVPRGPVV
jgi:CysZ protein